MVNSDKHTERSVVFVGAGNLATHLAAEMAASGFQVVQVYSRTEHSAEILAEKLSCGFTTDIQAILPDAGLYVFALKDDILPELISRMKPNNGLWVHTSGSSDMQLFESYNARYGVLYPLQTFSKEKTVDFAEIPILVEANTESDTERLEAIGRLLSRQVVRATSEQRRTVHLSAVFACNFSNHMYAVAAHLLKEHRIPFEVLLPLIRETAAKIETIEPAQAQTGPAMRYDKKTIDRHLQLLEGEPALQSLYEAVSQNIYRYSQKNESHE